METEIETRKGYIKYNKYIYLPNVTYGIQYKNLTFIH